MSAHNFIVKEHTVPTSFIREYRRATLNQEADELVLHVKQYTPRSNPSPKLNDITIIAAAGLGYVKELYEPLWDELLYQSESTRAFRIRSIWITDPSNQGQSAILNAGKMGNDPSWLDHPRDLFLMINHFRGEISRPIVGMGHSQGGNCIVSLALMHPRLFTTLVLFDPILKDRQTERGANAALHAVTLKRDMWPSRKAAEEAFKRNKFFQSWDSRVLDLYVEHGLVDVSPVATSAPGRRISDSTIQDIEGPPVTLKTDKHQESFYSGRPKHPPQRGDIQPYWPPRHIAPDLPDNVDPSFAFYVPNPVLVYSRLAELRPSCLYIQPETTQFASPSLLQKRLEMTGIAWNGSGGVKEGMVEERRIEGTTHSLPFEKPFEVAREACNWLTREMEFHHEQEAEAEAQWAKLSDKEKSTISEERMWWVLKEKARAQETLKRSKEDKLRPKEGKLLAKM